jgi:radical SAM/Cys-rich protein
VRTNLTALTLTGAEDTVELFVEHRVRLLASLPSADPATVAAQRGRAAFERSIEALRLLNARGYGSGGPLRLDLAVNPSGTEPLEEPGSLAASLASRLAAHGVIFDGVVRINNMPLGRFARGLRADDRLGGYLTELRARFNPCTVQHLACRHGIEVAWDGSFSDCDFNLAAGLGCAPGVPRGVFDVELEHAVGALSRRRIRFGEHCFTCTAGAGSG